MGRGPDAPAGVMPRLVVTSGGRLAGAVLPFEDDDLIVGRGPSVDVRLDDPHVSRVHARFRRTGSGMSVQDLGSTGGTTVNGVPATDAIAVRAGDCVAFADLETRYEDGGAAQPPPSPAVTTDPQTRQLDVGSQSANQLNNVLGDQYIQHLHVERTAFLEELATLRSRGRRLVIAGFLLSMVGFATYAFVILRFIDQVQEAGPSSDAEDFELLGPSVGGVPLGAIGFALFFLGSVLILVGIVQHVMAAARRRAWNRAHPEPGVAVLPGARP
jgi:hypothetical protein